MSIVEIRLADFSRAPGVRPGARHRPGSLASAKIFREEYVIPAIGAFGRVRVCLDGVAGLSGAFLDEVFGGLVQHFGWKTLKQAMHHVQVVAHSNPGWKIEAECCMECALL